LKYKNPILRGFYPDPSICRVRDTVYLVNSTFEYLPAVPIFSSKNLIDWKQLGHCITRESQIDMKGIKNSMGIFAPTIRYQEGKFYVITTNVTKGNFYVFTDNPEGEWSKPIFVDIHGIDPSFYFENGKTYVQYAIFSKEEAGIAQVEINLQTGELLTTPKIISKGSGGRDVEGPHMYKINDDYYLLTAEGGTREGHTVTIRRSNEIWGPFEECPHNPILTNRNHGNQQLQNVGHGDMIEDENGNWWMVALAVRSIKHRHHLGRETILMPVTWDEEGWPVVCKGYAESEVTFLEDTSSLFEPQSEIKQDTDDFNEGILGMQWNTMREFMTDSYSLTERPGYLSLTLNQDSLNDLGRISFIGRRQQDFQCEVIVKLEFNTDLENEEAGITIFADNAHHIDFFLANRDGEQKVILGKRVSDLLCVSDANIKINKPIYLKIEASQLEYHFFYSYDNLTYEKLGMTYTRHMASETVDAAFTGVYIGMYATSNGITSNNKAYFDSFTYIGKDLER
jgi:xylan 1,4-beta-xylosidase